MPWRDPAIGAIAVDGGAAAVPALPPAPLRARRLSLPDRNFAYDGGRGCRAAAAHDDVPHHGGHAAARSTRADRALVPGRDRRRDAVVDRGRADPAGDRGADVAGLARVARRAARGAGVFLAARRLRRADPRFGRLLARSRGQLHRLQAARAADAGADHLRSGARRARQFRAEHRADDRRRQRLCRHRAVRGAQLRRPRPAAAGHAVALDDLLGHADAGHLRGDGAAAVWIVGTAVGGVRHAGAARRAQPDADARRVGRRRGRRRAAPAQQGLPPARADSRSSSSAACCSRRRRSPIACIRSSTATT